MVDYFNQSLRKTYQRLRQSCSVTEQQQASYAIFKQLKTLSRYRYAKNLALYYAVQREICLKSVWLSAASQGKLCYFPSVTAEKTLVFLPATPKTPFSPNKFNIPEPVVDIKKATNPDTLDIIFVPLVAFDLYCTRLGMGGGYYDRTLACVTRPLLVGVAYDFQRHFFLHAQPWDIPLDAIVTERTIYWKPT
ncbi:MAG: 5-formyltetrahydrofolate cyclo-ligase [Legionellaceae bacterium]|nr:5-formyltetrahydrofolate cyclo-ligase [Legionellaceae bacterium]HAF87373.1 5-formyltetrahydrofolate cyclo-ligase [Legionellales bacterium]HCA89325.1 5-formyltetrahydrofolate cyclo-ligase [Legionellales bacterium]|tara:strand:+ start:304 stop:879 length:576 start_codon:yes stop_codon:yes gene_type:complete